MEREQAIDEFLKIMDGVEAEYGRDGTGLGVSGGGWGLRRAVELLTALGIGRAEVEARIVVRDSEVA